jgi:hypothetical protein
MSSYVTSGLLEYANRFLLKVLIVELQLNSVVETAYNTVALAIRGRD